MDRVTPTSLANAFLATAGISTPVSTSGPRGVAFRSFDEAFESVKAPAVSVPAPAECQERCPLDTMEGKCRAIFAEVELLSDRLRHALEGRAHVEREAHALLQQADTRIQHLEDTVRQKEVELLYMRGAMESLRARVEFYECRDRRMGDDDAGEGPARRAAGVRGGGLTRKVMILEENNTNVSYAGNHCNRGGAVISPSDVAADTRTQVDAGGGSLDLCSAAVSSSSNAAGSAVTPPEDEAWRGSRSRVGHNALGWVKFLLERCLPSGCAGGNTGDKAAREGGSRLIEALKMLRSLQGHYTDPNGDPMVMNSLCAAFSNCIVSVAEELSAAAQTPVTRDARSTYSLQTPQKTKVAVAPEAAQEQATASDHETILRCRNSIVEENLQLLQSLMAVESSSREAWSTLQKC